jgi:HSP20 family protein
MALVRNEPWTLLSRLHEDINRTFNHWPDDESSSATAQWAPAVDVEEYVDRFELFVDLPGVLAKDVDITLDSGVLTLSGDRNAVRTTEELLNARRERGTGRFYRRFILPDTVDAEKVKAAERNGVLAVTIPKQARALPRKIKVAV